MMAGAVRASILFMLPGFVSAEGESKPWFLTPRVNHRVFIMRFYCRSPESSRWGPTYGTMTKGERETCPYDSHDAMNIQATLNPLGKFSSVRRKVTVPPQEKFKKTQGCRVRDDCQDLIEFGRCCFPQGLLFPCKEIQMWPLGVFSSRWGQHLLRVLRWKTLFLLNPVALRGKHVEYMRGL